MSVRENDSKSTCVLSLHIRHPSQDLSVVSKELGLKPFRIWQAGEPRTTPKGTKLDGVNEYSYCSIRFNNATQITLPAQIQTVLNQCRQHARLFEHLASSGGSVSLAVGWFASESNGEIFDWKLLSELAGLKFSLEMYIYNPDKD